MAIDPSIALQVRQPQIEPMSSAFARHLSLQQLIQQQDMNKAALAQAPAKVAAEAAQTEATLRKTSAEADVAELRKIGNLFNQVKTAKDKHRAWKRILAAIQTSKVLDLTELPADYDPSLDADIEQLSVLAFTPEETLRQLKDEATAQLEREKFEETKRATAATEQHRASQPQHIPAGSSIPVRTAEGGYETAYTAPASPRAAPLEEQIMTDWLNKNPGKTPADYKVYLSTLNDPERRPVSVSTLDAAGKPVTRFVMPKEGAEFPSQPTAEQRNRESALRNIDPILSAIDELSEKINTLQGIEAKAVGEAAKVAARLNYQDDVAEYEALISGFTPMVARAVGHVGVLTEQDVLSVRAMFPKPGNSKTLRDRKINRIKSLLGAQQSSGQSQPKDFSVVHDGRTYTFPTQKALDGFKKEMGIK